MPAHVINGVHPFLQNRNAQTAGLTQESVAHLCAGDRRKSRVIYDTFGFRDFRTQRSGTEPEEVQVPRLRTQRGGNAGRPAADNEQIVHSLHPSWCFSALTIQVFRAKSISAADSAPKMVYSVPMAHTRHRFCLGEARDNSRPADTGRPWAGQFSPELDRISTPACASAENIYNSGHLNRKKKFLI